MTKTMRFNVGYPFLAVMGSASSLTFLTWTLSTSTRPRLSGRSTRTWRSKRPPRSSAGSSYISTKSEPEIEKNGIARSIVTRDAMVPELGHVAYDEDAGALLGGGAALGFQRQLNSDETNREIDRAVRELAAAAFERAAQILSANRALLEEGAKTVLVDETMDEAKLSPLFARVHTPENSAKEAA